MAQNRAHSFQDYTGVDLSSRTTADEWSDSMVVGSCFYQESSIDATRRGDIEKSIFPVGITGITFDRCNLINVQVPAGNTVLANCQTGMQQIQNDLDDWWVDGSLAPTEPVNTKQFIELGISVDPADIPPTRLTERRTRTAEVGG